MNTPLQPDISPKQLQAIIASLANEHLWEQAARDPYWPKWTSLWWRFHLLMETGNLAQVPTDLLERFAVLVDGWYLHDLPLRSQDVPKGYDPDHQVLCLCALASLFRILQAGGLQPRTRLPWIWECLLKTQLPDGGFNCDENAHLTSRKSSLISTLPALEALLEGAPRPIPDQVAGMLNRGADYLLGHRFYRSSRGDVIASAWTKPAFPRFYDYDILRGLVFVVRWKYFLNNIIPQEQVNEAFALLQAYEDQHGWMTVQRSIMHGEYNMDWRNNAWQRIEVGFFAPLEELAAVGRPSATLTAEWRFLKRAIEGEPASEAAHR